MGAAEDGSGTTSILVEDTVVILSGATRGRIAAWLANLPDVF